MELLTEMPTFSPPTSTNLLHITRVITFSIPKIYLPALSHQLPPFIMVVPEDSTSLNDLLQAIIDLDVRTNDSNNLHGKSYELTWNQALGYGKHPETGSYHVFIPYGTWKASSSNSPVPSILEGAFKDVLDCAAMVPPSGGKFFIDIATLSTSSRGFFTED